MAQTRARRFIASSAVFFIGGVLAHLIQFFLLPLYTRAIDPGAYGNYDLWTNLLIFLAPVAFFQVWDAVYRMWFDGSDKDSVITNGYLLMLAGLVLYTIVMTPVLIGTHAAPAWLIYLFGLSWCLVYFYGFIARGQLRNTLYVGSGIVNTLLNAGLGVLFVLGLRTGIMGVYLAVVAGNIIQAVIIEVRLRTYRHLKRSQVSREMIQALLRFSLPLCLASVASWAFAGFTRIAINAVMGNDANGLYAVADKYSYVITMVMSVFLYAWNETIYLSHRDQDKAQLYRLGISGVLTFAVVGSAATMLFAHLTWTFLVGPAFAGAWVLVPLLVFAAAINASAGFTQSLFMAEKKTAPVLWTTLIGALVNVGLAFPLVHVWGLQGAAVSLIISYVVMLLLRVILISRTFDVMVLQPDLVLSVAVAGGVAVLYWSSPSLLVTLLALVAVAAYFLAVTRRFWLPMLTQLRSRGKVEAE